MPLSPKQNHSRPPLTLKNGAIAFWAPEDSVADLKHELTLRKTKLVLQSGRLFVTEGGPQEAWFAENIWLEPKLVSFTSITSGADELRLLGRRWALAPVRHHRRAELIQKKLISFPRKPTEFMAEPIEGGVGAWSLLEPQTLIASAKTSHPYPNGVSRFAEPTYEPPSRAYLKLWELFTVEQFAPRGEEICLDLGASPGGWSWVLTELGAQVISVDKAELAPVLQANSKIRHLRLDAFTLEPKSIGRIDWLFCDVICDPNKLYLLINKWLASGLCQNFVCTLKFKGQTDFSIIEKFAAIPGSKMRHLMHNKHELTWWKLSLPLRRRDPSSLL